LLLVNTASFCGYTHQFTKLRQLDSAYQSFGFRVIGFHCNDFGGQDSYADSTINSFCINENGIQFPMMAKISIVQGDTSPVYKWLQCKALNGVSNVSVSWNFNKFLIDENGNWVRHFFSPTELNDTAIINWIMSPVTRKAKTIPGQWRVFENAAHQLCIQTEVMVLDRIRLFSMQGRLLKEAELTPGNNENFLSTEGLPVGSYLLEIQEGSGMRRAQLIRKL
jgi:glutathione peroxidase